MKCNAHAMAKQKLFQHTEILLVNFSFTNEFRLVNKKYKNLFNINVITNNAKNCFIICNDKMHVILMVGENNIAT